MIFVLEEPVTFVKQNLIKAYFAYSTVDWFASNHNCQLWGFNLKTYFEQPVWLRA